MRESCLNCHQPHGSSHEPLLVAKRPLLCQRCHNALGHPSVLWARSSGEAAREGLCPDLSDREISERLRAMAWEPTYSAYTPAD